VKIQHHDRRKRHHRADRQIEIAADHDEGHAERHDTQDCRGANDAHDIFGRQETFGLAIVNPIMKITKAIKMPCLARSPPIHSPY
jgi:hypothetical protein